jgi:hypothetical protein
MKYAEETNIIITTHNISKSTILFIVEGMGYAKITRFVQDGDCGWVRMEDYDGIRSWHYVVTLEAAQLLTGTLV